MKKILKNSIKCNLCGDIIVSRHVHDYVKCACGCCAVDGGNEYLRRTYMHSRDDFTDLSEFEEDEEQLD